MALFGLFSVEHRPIPGRENELPEAPPPRVEARAMPSPEAPSGPDRETVGALFAVGLSVLASLLARPTATPPVSPPIPEDGG